MIVAMSAVSKVQVPSDDIVHMVAMGDGVMPTARSVTMAALMFVTGVCRSTGSGILAADGECMFVDVVLMEVVEVAIVQVVDMAFVCDRLVAAVSSMAVAVVVVERMAAHHRTPSVTVDESRGVMKSVKKMMAGARAAVKTAVIAVGRVSSDPDANGDFCKVVRLLAKTANLWSKPC